MSRVSSQKPLNAVSDVSLKTGQMKKIGCAISYLILGCICLILGILSVQYDFQELALNERIKLRPGLPAYEKWKDPSGVDFGVKVYIFAVENPNEFLANNQTKLKLKEIGPIYYKRTVQQKDIVFNDDDSTMSFSTVQNVEFIEEMNEPGILNKTITLINPILLSLAAMIHDEFLAKMAFDLAATKDHVFINRTVYEVLWNSTSPMLELVKKIPFAAPRPNAGILFNSFYPASVRYNVNIGPKHGYENFFKINTLNGKPWINVFGSNFPKYCPYSLKGASEGTGLPPRMTKDTVIQAYTNNLCRTYPVVYNQTVKSGSIDAYEYIFARDIYKRKADPEKDCLKRTGSAMLPDGLIDSSRCAFGTPVALSNPHFYGYEGQWDKYLDGLAPQLEKHSSHMIVEPTTGIQLDAVVRIQSNIPLPELDYYPPNIRRFSKMILPQFWMEASARNNDPMVRAMIFAVINMPVIQPIVIIILFTLSVFAIYKAVKQMTTLNLSRTWTRSKDQKIIYPTTSERYSYVGVYRDTDDSERTAL